MIALILSSVFVNAARMEKAYNGSDDFYFTTHKLGFGGTWFGSGGHEGYLELNKDGDVELFQKLKKGSYNLSLMLRLCSQETKVSPAKYTWNLITADLGANYGYGTVITDPDPEYHTVGFLAAGAKDVAECAKLFKHGWHQEKHGLWLTFDAKAVRKAMRNFTGRDQALQVLALQSSEKGVQKAMNLRDVLKQQKGGNEIESSEEDITTDILQIMESGRKRRVNFIANRQSKMTTEE